jgi:ABC-2 type transport system ATP-binding protein
MARIVKIGTLTELMENVEGEHKMMLRLNRSIQDIKEELESDLVNCRVEILDEHTCLIISRERTALFPVLQLLDNKGISVYEAKESSHHWRMSLSK